MDCGCKQEWPIFCLARWELVHQKLCEVQGINFGNCWRKRWLRGEIVNWCNFRKSDSCEHVASTGAALPGAHIVTDVRPTLSHAPDCCRIQKLVVLNLHSFCKMCVCINQICAGMCNQCFSMLCLMRSCFLVCVRHCCCIVNDVNQTIRFMKQEMLSGDASNGFLIVAYSAMEELRCSQGYDRPSLLLNCCEVGWRFAIHVKCCSRHCRHWLRLVIFGVAQCDGVGALQFALAGRSDFVTFNF